MAVPLPVTRYDLATRILHWLQAALILGLVALGWWMTGLTYYDRWYNDALFWHRALGLLVLVVAACQFGRRHWRTPPPALLAGWEQWAASAMHRLFLLLMLLLPVSGYLISTSAGASIPLPGGIEVPALVAVADNLREIAVNVHYWLAYGIAALAALHAAAAFKHHFIHRDEVLRRML